MVPNLVLIPWFILYPNFCYYQLEVSNCGILRLPRFWNIMDHDGENNHDIKILKIFADKLMQQVVLHSVLCVLWFI